MEIFGRGGGGGDGEHYSAYHTGFEDERIYMIRNVGSLKGLRAVPSWQPSR